MPKTLVPALALLTLPTAAVAQTQAQRPCISAAENEAVVGYILPSLVTALATKCGTGAGYLTANAARLSARLQPNSDTSWAAARGAAGRVTGNAIPADGALGRLAKTAIGPALADGIAGGFEAKNCATMDRLMEQLAPLPAKNLAGALALVVELGDADNAKLPYRVCR